MIWFSQRKQIERLFLAWCEENHVATTPSNLIAFLQLHEWLNEEKIEKETSCD